MSLNLTTVDEKDYLIAKISGHYTYNEVKKSYKEIMDICNTLNKNKLFIDIRNLEGTISFFDRFNLANFFQDYIDRYVKMVILIKDNPAYKERIFETVANNRGIFIKIVTEPEEAYQFLSDINLRTAD